MKALLLALLLAGCQPDLDTCKVDVVSDHGDKVSLTVCDQQHFCASFLTKDYSYRVGDKFPK